MPAARATLWSLHQDSATARKLTGGEDRSRHVIGGEVKDRRKRWDCACGLRLQLTDEQIRSGKETCPQCGAVVGDHASTTAGISAADTQLINIGDMARMAQEGVDVGVSGEWDTAKSGNTVSQSDDDRDL